MHGLVTSPHSYSLPSLSPFAGPHRIVLEQYSSIWPNTGSPYTPQYSYPLSSPKCSPNASAAASYTHNHPSLNKLTKIHISRLMHLMATFSFLLVSSATNTLPKPPSPRTSLRNILYSPTFLIRGLCFCVDCSILSSIVQI